MTTTYMQRKVDAYNLLQGIMEEAYERIWKVLEDWGDRKAFNTQGYPVKLLNDRIQPIFDDLRGRFPYKNNERPVLHMIFLRCRNGYVDLCASVPFVDRVTGDGTYTVEYLERAVYLCQDVNSKITKTDVLEPEFNLTDLNTVQEARQNIKNLKEAYDKLIRQEKGRIPYSFYHDL